MECVFVSVLCLHVAAMQFEVFSNFMLKFSSYKAMFEPVKSGFCVDNLSNKEP
jgi:hypothetical protein